MPEESCKCLPQTDKLKKWTDYNHRHGTMAMQANQVISLLCEF